MDGLHLHGGLDYSAFAVPVGLARLMNKGNRLVGSSLVERLQ